MSRNPAGRRRHALVVAAAAWSGVLLVLAVALPFVTPEPAPVTSTVTTGSIGTAGVAAGSAGGASGYVTLVQADGYRILILVAVPLLASVLVGLLLRRAATTGSRSAVVAARVVASLVLLGAVVGFLTFLIGIAAVPTGALLLAAVLQRPGPGVEQALAG